MIAASRRPARGRRLPIVFIGNIGVIGVEGLLASMQSIGLDFCEFITKFYKGGALSLQPLYVSDGDAWIRSVKSGIHAVFKPRKGRLVRGTLGCAALIVEGDRVLFLTEKRKKHIVRVVVGERFHTEEGFVDLSGIVGKPYGSRVETNTGRKWVVLRPTLQDKILKMPRITQIVYPKDLGLIMIVADVHPGSFIVEAGTGSGVLTAVLADHVRPHGKIYSYELEGPYILNARQRLAELGLLGYVELKHGDITVAIHETDVDSVILDIPTPWLAAPNAHKALKPGGVLVSLSPTIEQVVNTVEAMRKSSFVGISTVELLMRELRVRRGMTRPKHIMRAHTTYITHARKALKSVHAEDEPPSPSTEQT